MQFIKKPKRRFRKGKDTTMITFEYKDYKYETDDVEDLYEHVEEWIERNFEKFVEWSNYLVTKDNYEEWIEAFLEETVTES